MDEWDERVQKRARLRRLSIGLAISILVALVAFTLIVALDLLFTKPGDFAVGAASVNLTSASPTADATVDLTFEPKFSEVSLTGATCDIESGDIYVDIEPLPTDGSARRYRLHVSVNDKDLENHGDLVWNVATGQKEFELLGCAVHLKIWLAHFIPIAYTYTIDDFGSLTASDETAVYSDDGEHLSDDPEKQAHDAESSDEWPFSAKVSGGSLVLTYRPSLEIPGAVPVQLELPGIVMSAGTASSRNVVLHFEGMTVQELSSLEELSLSIACDGECAWYNPIVDVALEGGGIVEVTVDAGNSFVEYVLGRDHEIIISKNKKDISPRRRMEEFCSVTCVELISDVVSADLCSNLRVSEGLLLDGYFEAFGTKGGVSSDLKWKETEEEDGVNIAIHSLLSLNENSKMNLSGNITAMLLSDEVTLSSVVSNVGGNWPMESSLQSSIKLNDDTFSIKVDKLYASWKDSVVADASSEFSVDFSEGLLNGFFTNIAPDWPMQSVTSASATWSDDFFNATLDEAQLVWKNDLLIDSVGSFSLDVDSLALVLTAKDPAYDVFLSGSIVDRTLASSFFLFVDGGTTITSESSGFLRELETQEGFQIGSSSRVFFDGEEVDLTTNFVFLNENLDISVNVTNAAGSWPMDFMFSGRSPGDVDGFMLLIDKLYFRFRETVVMDTIIRFLVDLSNDFELSLTAVDPSFSIDAGTQVEIADNIDLPEYTDKATGSIEIQIDSDTVVQFSFEGEVVWSNIDDGFRVIGSVKEEALYSASLDTILDVQPEYDDVLGIDRVGTKLEQFLFVVEGSPYADATGSVKLGFDNKEVRIVLDNTARTSFKAATVITWSIEDDENASRFEIDVSQATVEVGSRSFIDVTGLIFVQETSDINIGKIEWQTGNDVARLQSSAEINYILRLAIGDLFFDLQSSLDEGKLSLDDENLIDWKMDLNIRHSEEIVMGMFAVESENQDAFVRVNGQVGFQLDEAFTAGITPVVIEVDSSTLTNFTTEILFVPIWDNSTFSMSLHMSDEEIGGEMTMERMQVDWPDDSLNVAMEGVFLYLPGGSSPVLDGEMALNIDFDQEYVKVAIENNTTKLFVNADIDMDYGGIGGGTTTTSNTTCFLS